jgi:hypothetical protein
MSKDVVEKADPQKSVKDSVLKSREWSSTGFPIPAKASMYDWLKWEDREMGRP